MFSACRPVRCAVRRVKTYKDVERLLIPLGEDGPVERVVEVKSSLCLRNPCVPLTSGVKRSAESENADKQDKALRCVALETSRDDN